MAPRGCCAAGVQGRPKSLNQSSIVWNVATPYSPPGMVPGRRKTRCRRCGLGMSEKAKALLSSEGYGLQHHPARKGAHVRRVLRREIIWRTDIVKEGK